MLAFGFGFALYTQINGGREKGGLETGWVLKIQTEIAAEKPGVFVRMSASTELLRAFGALFMWESQPLSQAGT